MLALKTQQSRYTEAKHRSVKIVDCPIDQNGNTALHLAAIFSSGSEVVQCLVKQGADRMKLGHRIDAVASSLRMERERDSR